jgi:hypothetical protein
VPASCGCDAGEALTADPIFFLEKSGTTPPPHSTTKGGREWKALTFRVHDEGLEDVFLALSACGLGIGGAFGKAVAWGFTPCGRWFCPPCARRQQRRMTERWVRHVSRAIGASGGCGTMVLTLSAEMSPAHRMARLRQTLEMIRRRIAWKSPIRGWAEKVGVLCAFEVSAGQDGAGHPHVHLLVFGPDRREVAGCQNWLLETWLALNPAARMEGQKSADVIPTDGEWEARVEYLFKGTRVDAQWPALTIRKVLALFPAGSKHFTSWGRLSKAPRVRLGKRVVPPSGPTACPVMRCA